MNEDAVRRYKELALLNTDAVRRMREYDRARIDALRTKLGETDAQLAEATQREELMRASVRLHWESAVEQLWNERWLEVRPPEPIEMADDASTRRIDAEVSRTHEALREALRRTSILPIPSSRRR